MDVVYQVRYVFDYEIFFDTIAEENDSFEILDFMQNMVPDMFELIPTTMIEQIPYYFDGLDVDNDSGSVVGSIYADPIGNDVVGTPRGNVSCDHYRVEGTMYGVDVTVDVWYYPGTFLPSKIVADYGGNVLTLVSDSSLLKDGSGNGPGFEPELPQAPAQDTEFTVQNQNDGRIIGYYVDNNDIMNPIGTVDYHYEIKESEQSSGSLAMNWDYGTIEVNPLETALVDIPWMFVIGEKPDVSNASSLGKELVGTYRGELLCDHYSMSYDGMKMEWWNYSGTDFIAMMEITYDSGPIRFFFDSNRIVESENGGGSDTAGEPTGGDRTFAFGEPQVGDWISGNLTEESDGVTIESTIMFKVTAIEGNTMTIEVTMTEEGAPAFEPEVLEGIPTSMFGTFPVAYIVLSDSPIEPVLVGSEVTDTSRGDVLCDRYNFADMLDYYVISGTDFVAKMVISNGNGTGTFLFDSNNLVETS